MMKRISLALAVLTLVLSAAPTLRAQSEVSIDFFYNNLNDGNWVEVGDYGYCWQPSVAVSNSDWRPYADGYWAYTNVGWTWVSYEDFGWATYHYGRWLRLEDQGWVWVPGYEWGPAWVSWRTGGDYIGWAPLPPRGERVYEGRPITGHVDVEFNIGPLYYNFVDVRYIGEPVLRRRIVAPTQNVIIINNTVNVTNITYNNSTVYNYGPNYDRISRYSVRPIQRLTLQRETNANFSAGITTSSVTRVEGQKLVIAAPQKIRRPEKAVTPKNVKAKIAQAKVERGWSGVSDPQVKARLEQKMKTEDAKKIPPPDIAPNQNAAAAAAATPAPKGAEATPAQTKPAATPAIVHEKGKHKGNHGEMPGTNPSVTAPSENAAAISRERGKEQRGKKGEKNVPPKPTPNAIEHNDAAGMAPDNQPSRGQKVGREHNEMAPVAPEASKERGQGRRQQQNELAPTGKSDKARMHQDRPNAPQNGAQGQPRSGGEKKGRGQEKKKGGGEPAPTPDKH